MNTKHALDVDTGKELNVRPAPPSVRCESRSLTAGHHVFTNGEIAWATIAGHERTFLEVREAIHWLSSNGISSFKLVTV